MLNLFMLWVCSHSPPEASNVCFHSCSNPSSGLPHLPPHGLGRVCTLLPRDHRVLRCCSARGHRQQGLCFRMRSTGTTGRS